MKYYIKYILLFAVLLSTMIVQWRIVGFGIAYLPENMASRYPRLVEVLAILYVLFYFNYKAKFDKTQRLLLLVIVWFTVFALFKPFFIGYIRSSAIVPLLLMMSCMRSPISDENIYKLLYSFFAITALSSLFVILSTRMDIGVSVYYSNEYGSQRYIGYGQSLPYQAAYSLFSIPLFAYIQQKTQNKWLRMTNLFLVVISLMAIILTGARTAYVILVILGLFYVRKLKTKTILYYSIPLLIIFVYFVSNYIDVITSVLTTRNEVSLAGRDNVWLIAIQLVLSHPFLGIQNFFTDGQQFGHVNAHVQNGYFEIVFWGGIFLLLLYCTVFKRIYKIQIRNSYEQELMVGLLIIFCIYMLSEILLYSVQDYFPFMIILGLLYSNSKNKRQIA